MYNNRNILTSLTNLQSGNQGEPYFPGLYSNFTPEMFGDKIAECFSLKPLVPVRESFLEWRG
jgi:hypothetical protein